MKEYMFNGFNMDKPNNKRNKQKNIENRTLNWGKVFKVSICFLIIILIIVFAIVYENNEPARNFFDKYIFRKHASENNLPTIDLDANTSYNFFAHDDKIICLSKNTLTFYNKNGNKEHELNIEITNPIFESNDNYLCIAEKDGQKLYLISDNNIVWQKNLEGNISNINLNKNGYVSVSLSGTSYKTIVLLINPQGNELFKNYLSSSYVIDTSICDNNKYLAIAETNLSGTIIQSNIEIISIEKATHNSEEAKIYNYVAPTNKLILDINYINKDILACRFDDSISYINNNELTEICNFTDTNILFSDINSKIIQIEKEGNGITNSSFRLEILTPNSENINTYSIDDEPKSIKVYDNIIAINLGSEILFINNNGWLLKQYKSSHEVKDIILCNNIAGIIYSNKIEILSL